jgi:hypothetical protein
MSAPLVSRSFAVLLCSVGFLTALPIALFAAARAVRFARAATPEARKAAAPSARTASRLGALFAIAVAVMVAAAPSMSPKEFDPYAELGLASGAPERAVQSAYRRLSLTYHPDKATGDKDRFRRIVRAYESIVDPVGRQNFERFGNPEGDNKEDKFGDMDKVTAESKTAFLAAYVGAFALATLGACVYGRRAARGSADAGEAATQAALDGLDAVPALPGAKRGVLNAVLEKDRASRPPVAGDAPLAPEPAPAALPARAAGAAAFKAAFGPLFAATALKNLDGSTPFPAFAAGAPPAQAPGVKATG